MQRRRTNFKALVETPVFVQACKVDLTFSGAMDRNRSSLPDKYPPLPPPHTYKSTAVMAVLVFLRVLIFLDLRKKS